MKVRLPIYGIDCETCELLVDTRISKLAGVEVTHISKRGDYIDLELQDKKDLQAVKDIIIELGYRLSPDTGTKKSRFGEYIFVTATFFLVGIIYFFLKDTTFFSSIASGETLGLRGVFGIGVLASLSSCLVVTAGVIIGLSNTLDSQATKLDSLKLHSHFHLGRIGGFIIGGAILGWVGSYLQSWQFLNIFFLLFVGLLMLYIGVRMVGVFPKIPFVSKIFAPLGKKVLQVSNPRYASLIGVGTFFLPCGFTQSMQALAASSGSIWNGALIMGVFALGTLPVLLALGIGSSYFKQKNIDALTKTFGVVIVYIGIFMLGGFANLFAWNSPDAGNIEVNEGFESVFIIHNGAGFLQKEVHLDSGKDYILDILPTQTGLGCNSSFTIPGIDSRVHETVAGERITIPIENAKPGVYPVVCSTIGVSQGKIIIQ